MKKAKLIAMKILVFGLSLCLFACSYSPPPEKKPVAAVYTSWKASELPIASIPWDRFTHIVVAFAHPTSSGDLNTKDIDPFIEELVSEAKERNKLVMLSVGGAGEGSRAFRTVAANPELKRRFISNLLTYATDLNLNGIDIDWEFWTYQHELKKGGNDPVESQHLVDLLRDLNETKPKSMILSTDVIAGHWLGPQYKTEIQNYVDYVNVMAFDFTGAWQESKVAHHSDVSTFKKAVSYFLKRGFSPEKLMVGLPTYGIEFVDGKNTKAQHIPYHEIVLRLDYDYTLIDKGRYGDLFFDTKASYRRKSEYILSEDLAGVSVFDLASDHQDKKHSLIETLDQYFLINNRKED